MTPGIKKILVGAATGFASAFVVDIQAWSKSTGPYDWKVAIKRWVSGAVTGGTTAAGIAALV